MKYNYINTILLAAISVLMLSCANSQVKETSEQDYLYKACKDPRPQICTREYRPVCAIKDTGIRCVTTPCQSTTHKTYGNACSACGDPKVISYHSGACEETTK